MSSTMKVLACLLYLATNYLVLGNNVETLEGQMQYLQDYNYMAESSGPSPSIIGETQQIPDAFIEALKLFQSKRGLNVTGEMNNETLEVMQRPRCGMPDIFPDGDWFIPEIPENSNHSEHSRKRRYTLLGRNPEDYGWDKNSLTYSLQTALTGNTNLPESRQKEVIKNAFALWQEHADIEVEEAFSYIIADIHLHFYKRYHGDIAPFDGPGGKLAHAFSPSSGGNIHFDAEENWTIDDYSGKDLFQITVHEVGHSLGLGHVDNSDSVMYPEYIYRNNFKLSQDDIDGMQFLYGARSTTEKITTTTTTATTTTTTKPPVNNPETTTKKLAVPTTTEKPITTTNQKTTTTTTTGNTVDVCDSTLFDDIDFNSHNSDKYYIHKGNQIAIGNDYYYSTAKVESVITIGQEFPKLPSAGIDAVVTLPKLVQVYCTRWLIWVSCGEEELIETERTYYFKGSQYFMYQQGQYQGKGMIDSKFPNIPNDLDAAFTTQGGKDIYFVKGGQVWRFAREGYTVHDGYPKQLTFMVSGLPNDIKAVTNRGVNNYFLTTSFIYRATYSTLSEMFTLDKDFTKKTSDWVDCSSIHDIEEDQDVIEKLPKNETSSKSKRSASEQMGTIYIDQNGLIVDTEAANFRWNEEFEAWLEQNVDLASGSTSVVVCITNVIFTTGLVLIMWLW